jgi:dolichol-phosphate mannosyltransferase
MYKQKLSDIQTGYWVLNRRAVETVLPNLVAKGFDIEYDMLYNAWKSGLKIRETPVTFRRRIGDTKFRIRHRLRQIAKGLKYVYLSLVHLYGGRDFS